MLYTAAVITHFFTVVPVLETIIDNFNNFNWKVCNGVHLDTIDQWLLGPGLGLGWIDTILTF